MEENADKYVKKWTDLLTKEKFKIFHQFFTKPNSWVTKKPRFKIGKKSQFTSETYQVVKIANLKPPTFSLYGEQDDAILDKFNKKRACKVYHLEMNSFTVEFVSNASFDCYPNNKLSYFTNFHPEQTNLEGDWEVAITEISYASLYQNITKGKLFYLDKATPDTKQLDYYKLDPGLYPSISDIVNEMNKTFRNVESMKKYKSVYTLTKLHSELLWVCAMRIHYLL